MDSRYCPHSLVALLILTLFVSFSSPSAKEEAKRKPITLKVCYLPFLSFGPFLIAEEEGYFSEQNIKIEFIRLKRSAHGLPALAQGKLDVLAGSITAGVLNAVARGAPIKIVADKGHIGRGPPPSTALLARTTLAEEGGLSDPAKLRGLTLVGSSDNISAYFSEKALNRFGLSRDDMQTYRTPHSARLEAMEKGTADIISTQEPWLTRQLQAGHAVLWVSDYEVIPDFQYAYVAFGPSLLEQHPEVGKRFMVAYLTGVRQYNEGKTERNLEILAKHTKLDRDLLKKACWIACRSDGRINVESVLDFQVWAVQEGMIESPVTPDEFWDPSFVEYAEAVLEKANKESD